MIGRPVGGVGGSSERSDSAVAGRAAAPPAGARVTSSEAAGSAGAMTGFSHPAVLAAVLAAYREGGFVAARDVWAPWLPMANFEGQPRIGLAIRKEVLRRRGLIASGRVRRPARSLPATMVPLLDQHLAALPVLPAHDRVPH